MPAEVRFEAFGLRLERPHLNGLGPDPYGRELIWCASSSTSTANNCCGLSRFLRPTIRRSRRLCWRHWLEDDPALGDPIRSDAGRVASPWIRVLNRYSRRNDARPLATSRSPLNTDNTIARRPDRAGSGGARAQGRRAGRWRRNGSAAATFPRACNPPRQAPIMPAISVFHDPSTRCASAPFAPRRYAITRIPSSA